MIIVDVKIILSIKYYICSIRHNTGIILIFLQHNVVVSENCERCMQILPATRSRMYKVDKRNSRLNLIRNFDNISIGSLCRLGLALRIESV